MAKERDPLIDFKVLKAELKGLLAEHAVTGLTADEARDLLIKRAQYADFAPDHVREDAELMLAMLVTEGQVASEETRKGDRYRPAPQA